MEGMSDEPPPIKTILLVEDDIATASWLSELLAQQAAYQVILVSDCLTTLKFLHYCKPDLIFLDERLLHINGIDLKTSLLKKREKLGQLASARKNLSVSGGLIQG